MRQPHSWVACLMVLTALVVLTAAVSACNRDGPRKSAFPAFDARAPFAELNETTSAAEDTSAPADDQSAYEEAIARARRQADPPTDPPVDTPSTVETQRVSLGGVLVASIPLRFHEWQWATDGGVTLIVHRKPGGTRPDALVYVERFGELIDRFPSVETRRFINTVDPRLVDTVALADLAGQRIRALSRQTGIGVDRFTDAMATASSHTMGLGLNYTSADESFGGWRWVGRNSQSVELRLGRTTGAWSAHADPDPSVSDALAQASEQIPRFDDIRKRYEATRRRASEHPDGDRPAWMLLGSAVIGDHRGLHVAMVCDASPECPVAADFAELLAGLHAAGADESVPLPRGGSDLAELARQQGLGFIEEDRMLVPDELGRQLRP